MIPSTAKRLYTRKKNELSKLAEEFNAVRNIDISPQNIVRVKHLHGTLQSNYDAYLDRKRELEDIVPDETERARTILPDDEDMELTVWRDLQSVNAKLLQVDADIAAEEARRREEQAAAEARCRDEEAAAEASHMRDMERRQLEFRLAAHELECQVRMEELRGQRSPGVQANVNNLGHLPKISLVRFGGESLKFSEFWGKLSIIDRL
uniref:Uncharacterized protein n=1 Tax=Cacopsylla melanoneura TaxID=428564 RepID=A0A8D8Z8L1_9HEMI